MLAKTNQQKHKYKMIYKYFQIAAMPNITVISIM